MATPRASTTPPPPEAGSAAPRKPMSYRWLLVLVILAVVVSALLVFAENRVYQPATPFTSGAGDHVHAFALDPMQPRHYYLGSHYGFFRTNDGGSNWARLNDAPGIAKTLVATSITLSPLDGRTAYVSGYRLDVGDPVGIYATTDDGAHWHQVPTGTKAGQLPDPRLLFVAAGWAQPGEVYAYTISLGLFRSLDRGAHWALVAPPFAGQVTAFVPMLACDAGTTPAISGPTCPERIFVGTTQGLAVADAPANGPLTFASASGVGGYIYAIAAHRGASPTVTVSTDQGLYQAASPAAALAPLATIAQGAPTFSGLVASGADPRTLYGVTTQDAVLHSADGGRTWAQVGKSLQTRGLTQLQSGLRQATGANTPQWAGGQNVFLTLLQAPATGTGEVIAALSFPVQLSATTDAGKTWRGIGG